MALCLRVVTVALARVLENTIRGFLALPRDETRAVMPRTRLIIHILV